MCLPIQELELVTGLDVHRGKVMRLKIKVCLLQSSFNYMNLIVCPLRDEPSVTGVNS